MYKKYYILILGLIVLYAFQIWYKLFSTYQGFIRDHLADLLALQLILTFGLIVVRKIKKLPFFYLNTYVILFAFIYTSILFEFILPKFDDKFTSDYIDILFYAAGTIIFYFTQERLKKDEYYRIA